MSYGAGSGSSLGWPCAMALASTCHKVSDIFVCPCPALACNITFATAQSDSVVQL